MSPKIDEHLNRNDERRINPSRSPMVIENCKSVTFIYYILKYNEQKIANILEESFDFTVLNIHTY